MNRLKKLLFLVFLIILAYGINLFLSPSNGEFEAYTVTKVSDGDTIWANNEKIRIIGVNTPELKSKEDFSNEAKDLTKSLVLNKKVYFEKDMGERDKYNRLLRYVWLKKPKKINREEIEKNTLEGILLAKGYARVYTFKPNIKYKKYFREIENRAKKEKVGMWKNSEEGSTRGN